MPRQRRSKSRGAAVRKYKFDKATGRKPSTDAPSASPVKVTRADGTIEHQPAYTPDELRRITSRAKRSPRTWSEINSTKGGGRDFGKPP